MAANAEPSHLVKLRERNAALRAELKLGDRRPPAGDTIGWLEKENKMLEHQIRWLKHSRELLKTEEGQQEALYLLQLLRAIPLPVWSADLDAKIVHWGSAAEKTYGHSGEVALERNFIDLFVNDPEKKQAEDDLVCIIFGQEGLAHFNLCRDKNADNDEVYLVTCCFPVFDARANRVVQAEISFDLSKLGPLEKELEELHRRHRAEAEDARAIRTAKERAVIEALIRDLFAEVKKYHDEQHEKLARSIATNREKLADETATRGVKDFHQGQLRKNEALLEELEKWERDMQTEIALADTNKALEIVRVTIRNRTRKHV